MLKLKGKEGVKKVIQDSCHSTVTNVLYNKKYCVLVGAICYTSAPPMLCIVHFVLLVDEVSPTHTSGFLRSLAATSVFNKSSSRLLKFGRPNHPALIALIGLNALIALIGLIVLNRVKRKMLHEWL